MKNFKTWVVIISLLFAGATLIGGLNLQVPIGYACIFPGMVLFAGAIILFFIRRIDRKNSGEYKLPNYERIEAILKSNNNRDKFRIEVDHNNNYVLVPRAGSSDLLMATLTHLRNNNFKCDLFKNELHDTNEFEIIIHKSAD